jgi:PAS domain S-box-containing protein
MVTPLRVLILEDQPADAELMLYELRRAGFAPVWERVETEAEYLAHLDQSLDVILADYHLPQFDALRALRHVQECELDVPFIIVSGNLGEEMAVQCVKQGATDYLLKDRLTRLGQAVGQALEQQHLRNARRQAEQSLRQAEEKYRSIFENAVEGIFQITPAGRLITVNPALVRMLGYPSAQALLEHLSDRGQPLDGDVFWRAEFIRHMVQHGAVSGFEVQLYRHDGSALWTSINARAVYDAGGGLRYYEGSIEDITERRRAEEALRESEERYRDLFEHANDLIYTHDLAGNFTSINRMGEQTTGYTRDEVLRMDFHHLVAPEHRALARQMLASHRAGTPSTTYELDIVAKSGQRVTLDVSTRLTSQAGHPFEVQGIARNVTERRLLEAQLRQAQKMEAIGTLASGIAHDFNNILAAILGYSELALAQVPPANQVRQHLQQILAAGVRAKELVQQILIFSRQSEQARRPLQLAPLVTEALALLRAALPATIELRQELTDTISTVVADPTQLHQVLLNLCTNAAHAMRDTGGVLTVGLDTCESVADLPSGTPRLPPGAYVRLTVQDTGHGMTRATVERIFEPFFTTKNVGEGTGLGLAVVHGIIGNHGGAIRVDSAPGHGTTFRVYLPRSDRTTAPAGPPLEAVPTGHECLLFVDDEDMLARLGQAALERLGYEVVACTSGQEALETFRVAPERFALVITDHMMPHMTGIDLTHALRRIRPALPIILYTGSSDFSTAEKAQALGIEALCMKPLLIHDLGRLVRQVLEQRPAQEA